MPAVEDADVPATGAAGAPVKDGPPIATSATAVVAVGVVEVVLPGVSRPSAFGKVTANVPPPPAPGVVAVPSLGDRASLLTGFEGEIETLMVELEPPSLTPPEDGTQLVLLVRSPAQTGVVTVIDPVEPDPPVDVVLPAVPPLLEQLVWLAMMPAHTGTEMATGPVRPLLPPLLMAPIPRPSVPQVV
jgi:hypothetical protein